MRGMLEDENTMKRNQAMKDLQNYNKMLALQKKQREAGWKDDQAHKDHMEITLTDHHEDLAVTGKITRKA